jgi:ribosomal protein S18 acetylase RimI-like enzyme
MEVSTPPVLSTHYRDDDIENQRPLLDQCPDEIIISFRQLETRDRSQIQKLHEQWFPVTYKDEFYDDLVLNRMVNSGEELYTCAAVVKSEETLAQEAIVACIVGSFIEVTNLSTETVQLLIADKTKHSQMFYIMTLGTIKEFRHHRIATSLVQQVTDMVEQEETCGAVYLHVITFNVPAIRFYEKLGFCRVTEIKDYYRIEDQHYNCFLYARYFHGNRGHRDYYYLITNLVSSFWRRLRDPFLSLSNRTSCDNNNNNGS